MAKLTAWLFAAVVVLMLPITGLAQCPINYVKVDPFGHLHIKFKNVSQQTISAVKFGVAFIDVTNDQHPSLTDYTASLHLAPNADTSADWDDSLAIDQYGYLMGVKVWLVKVVFADGTTWQPEPDKLGNQCWMTVSPRTRKR